MKLLATAKVRKLMGDAVNDITNINACSKSFDFLENEPEIYSVFLEKWLKNRKKTGKQRNPLVIHGKI